jgi:hypothetical protein
MSNRAKNSIVLLVLAIACIGGAARAGEPCAGGLGGLQARADGGDGLGGTGVRGPGGDDSGMGGTGAKGSGGTGSGMGGTGLGGEDDSGMGGTGVMADGTLGIVGTITGFGSICVNGERVAYDADMSVEIDGAQVSARGLAVGHVVAVRARALNGVLRAESISVRRAVVGPVTAVDAPRGRFYVMGQAVAIGRAGSVRDGAGEIALDRIALGQSVAVSGLHRDDGLVIASRVETVSAARGASVTGPVQDLAPGTLAIGGVRVAAQGRAGPFARAVGEWNAERGTLVASRVEPVSVGEGVERLSVEGFVREREGARFRLSGVEVDASRVSAQLPSIDRDVRVIAEGAPDARGVLSVTHLTVESDEPRGGPNDASRIEGEAGGDRDDQADRSDRGEREDRAERSERAERAERAERPERPERPARPERPERPERPDRSGR